MVGKLALFAAPTLIANLLIITFPNFEIKADCCCNRRGTDRHTAGWIYAHGVPVAWVSADAERGRASESQDTPPRSSARARASRQPPAEVADLLTC